MRWWKRLRKSTDEDYEKFARNLEEEKVGFKDKIAMVIAGFIVIILPCLLVLVAISCIALLLFGGFR